MLMGEKEETRKRGQSFLNFLWAFSGKKIKGLDWEFSLHMEAWWRGKEERGELPHCDFPVV